MATLPKPSPTQALNALDVTKSGFEAFKDGPPAVFIWAAGSIFALAAVTIPSLLAARFANFAFATFVFSAVAIGVLSWLSSRSDVRLFQYRWRVLRQPMQNDKLVKEVNSELKELHKLAAESFDKAQPGLGPKVRANIFFADFRQAAQGVAFELRMSTQFNRQMTNPSEARLSFQPGQGATGEVFLFGQPVLTNDRLYKVDTDNTGFDASIATDLQAIISLPIFDDTHANVIAIINIDVCGSVGVAYEHLSQVYEDIKDSVRFMNLSRALNSFDKAWLTIGLGRA